MEMDRPPPQQQPKPRRPRSHRSARLPDDCLKKLFEFAPLSSLLNTLLVSTPWRENALDDPRWDPILPPPALRAPSQWLRPSTRAERAIYARYYARYLLVLDNWRRAVLEDEGAVTTARGRTTALDGWFALAPWAKTGMRGGRPLAWLRHAVWLPEAARATDRLRRSARLPPRSRDQERCAFFNENHEDEQQEEGPQEVQGRPQGMKAALWEEAQNQPLGILQSRGSTAREGSAEYPGEGLPDANTRNRSYRQVGNERAQSLRRA